MQIEEMEKLKFKKANARLISACPDLLVVMIWSVDQINHSPLSHEFERDERSCETCKGIKKIKAVIRKAKGE